MSGWILALQLAALGLVIVGSVIASRGRRRAEHGAALARAAAMLQSQLTRPPREVIAEAQRGLDMANSGRRLALRGLRLSGLGLALSLGFALWQALS